MKTYEIHINGRVQGVGFRPFIFNLAKNCGLRGYVSNDESGVIIVIQGDFCSDFFTAIHQQKPVSSEIVYSEIKELDSSEIFESFYIKPTEENIIVDIPLTPDFATCENCEKEIFDKNNRRYFYPFTTCTQCGPRYSVTKKFPFERENTAIEKFRMCPACQKEYITPEDIRFHSQTNSCPECGIKIWLSDHKKSVLLKNNNQAIFEKLAEELHLGKIVACKNTAGYILLCDATNKDTIAELRKRKKRPTKPFAVLFPNMEIIEKHFVISGLEKQSLLSSESPIVILELNKINDLAISGISPNMNTIGVMYPYSGMLKLISKVFGKPLIATSANFHGSPICSTTEEAENTLTTIADIFLHNDLEVQHPQDDSVIKFSEQYHQKVIYRRARGFAPNFFYRDELSKLNPDNQKILCVGGDLKNTFSAVPNTNAYISEYIGDLANYDTYCRFQKTMDSYQDIFSFEPEIIIKDQHPRYENQNVISEFKDADIYAAQHHQAHFSAILSEKKLWNKEKVLGVIWDGTGYGSETEIFGGEFFSYDNKNITRFSHLETYPWILGDKMSKNPKMSALAISNNDIRLKTFFCETEWKIYTKFVNEKSIATTSMGRLFDAVAFVLGYQNTIFFEGESAMWLEKIAREAWRENPVPKDYLENIDYDNIPTQQLLNNILNEKEAGGNVKQIALNFHYTLIKAIKTIANRFFKTSDIEKNIAFSGGVWQNTLLIDLAIEILGNNFTLNFHESLSPNDENISIGQLSYYLNMIKNKE
ncbi:MAG: carbamoyltransferase HypF [Chryseobacterium sp.]|nr:MAG: carbamoyltransferase HypF [Chryseobacterium sp.]